MRLNKVVKVMFVSRELGKQADIQIYKRDVNAEMLLNSLRRNLRLIIAGSVIMALGAFLIGYIIFSYSVFFSFDVILRAFSTSFAGFLVGFFIFSALIVFREVKFGFVYLPAYESLETATIAHTEGEKLSPSEDIMLVKTKIETERMLEDGEVSELIDFPDIVSVSELAKIINTYPVAKLIIISPEGAVASQKLVELVRLISAQSMRVLLIETSGMVQNAEAMLERSDKAGITELLLQEATLAEVLHKDKDSMAQIMPLGLANPADAMQYAYQLPAILDLLGAHFDVIVIDCGAVLASDIADIYSENGRILFSVASFSNEQVAMSARDFDEAGYENIIILHDDKAV